MATQLSYDLPAIECPESRLFGYPTRLADAWSPAIEAVVQDACVLPPSRMTFRLERGSTASLGIPAWSRNPLRRLRRHVAPLDLGNRIVMDLRGDELANYSLFMTNAAEPTLVLRLGGRVPAELAGQPLEYAYRVDGGLYHSWVSGSTLVATDPVLWLQGNHTVEVMSRVVGRPETIDPSPVSIPVVVDTVPPKVHLVRVPGGARADVSDFVSPKQELSWSINGGPYGAFGTQRQVAVPDDATVAVKVRDASGNTALAMSLVSDLPEPAPADAEAGGCSMAASPTSGLGLLSLLLLVGLLVLRRRR